MHVRTMVPAVKTKTTACNDLRDALLYSLDPWNALLAGGADGLGNDCEKSQDIVIGGLTVRALIPEC